MDMLSKTELSKIKENIRYLSCENVLNSLKINHEKGLGSFVWKATIPILLSAHSNPIWSKFLCADCNVSYVGETYRHISTRIINI